MTPSPNHLTMNSGVLFMLLYSSYFLSYVSRKNIVFIAPHLMDKGFTKGDLGASQSTFSVCYLISKLSSNIICNWAPPRVVLSIGISCVGLINILAGVLDSPQHLWILWGLNGLCCGVCWPPIAVLIVSHFSEKSRGKTWSLVSSSMNAGATVSPLLTDFLVYYGSWNMSFYFTGVLDVLIGIVILSVIPPISSSSATQATTSPATPWQWGMVFNKLVGSICVGYTLLSFGVITMGTWGQMYFIEKLGVGTLSAGAIVSVYEIGGFCGATASGFFADFLAERLGDSRVSPRAYSAVLCCGIVCCSAFGLNFLPLATYFTCQICAFGFGFGVFGTIAMFGLMIREFVPREHGGTLSAVLAFASQIGGFSAGSPLAWYNDTHTIADGFWIMTCCMPAAFVFMLLLITQDGKYKIKVE